MLICHVLPVAVVGCPSGSVWYLLRLLVQAPGFLQFGLGLAAAEHGPIVGPVHGLPAPATARTASAVNGGYVPTLWHVLILLGGRGDAGKLSYKSRSAAIQTANARALGIFADSAASIPCVPVLDPLGARV